MRTPIRFRAVRAVALGTVAALAISAFAPMPVMAGTPSSKPETAAPAPTDPGVTDFSARRRQQVRHFRGHGGAAAAAAFAGIVGTIGAIAASQARRDYYEDHVSYGGPRYYGGGGYGFVGYPYGAPDYYGRGGYGY